MDSSLHSPAIKLLSYQKAVMRDRSRFLCIFWARGARKTFTATLKIVDSVFEAESIGKRKNWNIVSRGERQALEAMREVKRHFRAYNVVAGEIEGRDVWDQAEGRNVKVFEVVTNRGSRIMSLPASPDTIRGFTANMYLDEFGIQSGERSQALWKAAYPCLRGHLEMIVSSTPQGKSGKFYQIATDTTGVWTVLRTDIYDAVKAGLPFDLELERKALNDEDGWAQEYELQWLDELSAWLSYDLIATCEDDRAGEPGNYRGFPCYLGMDVARRRDLTALWVLEGVDGLLWTREVVKLRRAEFRTQLDTLSDLMERYQVRRACIDQTGLGEFLVDAAKERHGSRIEGVLFTAPVKQDLATVIKQRFQDRELRIPMDRDIRNSFHSVKKINTSAGNPRFDAERTEAGHADEFWACALATHAAHSKPTIIEYRSGGSPRVGYQLDDFLI